MEARSNVGLFSILSCREFRNSSPFGRFHPLSKTARVSALRCSLSVNDLVEQEAIQMFLNERQLKGDFVSKASDVLWRREDVKFVDSEASEHGENGQQEQEVFQNKSEGGFLKLTKTQEWVSGDETAPINKKLTIKGLWNDAERRKRLNILRYDALKREMMLLTIGIGTLCSGYCLVALSVQVAVSYAAGVLFSCLYLQLLCYHVDNLSREAVPEIFRQKKQNKIGIRSEDLRDGLEKLVKGSGLALSSPRLMVPATLYGLWYLSYHFSNEILDFQVVPAMVGMFAYKAAALVQVYRDNEDLRMEFPEDVF